MIYSNWLEAVRKGYEDPCEYQHKERYCEECDIEESRTYFIDETCICEDCYKIENYEHEVAPVIKKIFSLGKNKK